MTGAYVDDTIGTGDKAFEKESEATGDRFQSKPREVGNFQFAGIQIEEINGGYLMHQQRYAQRIPPLPKHCTFNEFRSKRHELAWLTHTRPDISAAVNLAAQVTEPKFDKKNVKELNDVIKRAHANTKRGIRQQRLAKESHSLRVFTD